MNRDNQGRNRHPAGAPKSIGGQYAPDNSRGGAASSANSDGRSALESQILRDREFKATSDELAEYRMLGQNTLVLNDDAGTLHEISVDHTGTITSSRTEPGGEPQLHRRGAPAKVSKYTTEHFNYGMRHNPRSVALISGSTGRYYIRGNELSRTDFYEQSERRHAAGVNRAVAELDDLVESGEATVSAHDGDYGGRSGVTYTLGKNELYDDGGDTLLWTNRESGDGTRVSGSDLVELVQRSPNPLDQ